MKTLRVSVTSDEFGTSNSVIKKLPVPPGLYVMTSFAQGLASPDSSDNASVLLSVVEGAGNNIACHLPAFGGDSEFGGFGGALHQVVPRVDADYEVNFIRNSAYAGTFSATYYLCLSPIKTQD